jgi:hypothetical protein
MTNSSSDSPKSEDKVFTSGIDAILERMRTHPEEFFEANADPKVGGRWRFIFKDYFRDAMTEIEKGRLHEALKQIRRMEFDTMVVKELMREELVDRVDASMLQAHYQKHSARQNAMHNQAQGLFSNVTAGTKP